MGRAGVRKRSCLRLLMLEFGELVCILVEGCSKTVLFDSINRGSCTLVVGNHTRQCIS